MKFLLPLIAVLLLVTVSPVWSEEGDQYEAERAELQRQGVKLLEQGALDYERLRQALTALEAKKAAMARSGGSLRAMDQLAHQAQKIDADIIALDKARSRLEDARTRLRTGRFEAAKQTFNEAVAFWAPVHRDIVAHIGEAPVAAAALPTPVRSPAKMSELQALRSEIQDLRAEIQALRADVRDLKALVQSLAR